MESEKLLPCPMCAGEGEAVCLRIGEDAVASWVRCLSCGLRTAEIEDAYSDLPSAVAAWNTRAPADLRSALEAETIERCERRARIQEALLATLDDSLDCTRVCSAWGYGTMGQDDFVPVLERLDELVDEFDAIIFPAALAPTTGDQS